jgi:superfamily I DNA and/or RNA helicase
MERAFRLQEVRNLMPEAGPILTISTSGLGRREAGRKSKINEAEVRAGLQHCKKLRKAGVKAGDIGIISPYKAQVNYQCIDHLLSASAD